MGPKPQNLTIQLDQLTIRRAKVLAAVRATSVSKLVAGVIDDLVRGDERYREAERVAKRLMKRGFHLGGARRVSREELHER